MAQEYDEWEASQSSDTPSEENGPDDDEVQDQPPDPPEKPDV